MELNKVEENFMNDFFNCVIVNNGIAFGTGVLLFLFTLLLASKRVFGFFFTLIFLLISLGGAMAVKNREGITNYVHELQGKKTEGGAYTGDSAAKSASVMEQLQKAYEDLKGELAEQKQKLEAYFQESKEGKKDGQTEPQKTENKPALNKR
jgi:hypothetical protein